MMGKDIDTLLDGSVKFPAVATKPQVMLNRYLFQLQINSLGMQSAMILWIYYGDIEISLAMKLRARTLFFAICYYGNE